MKEKIIEITRHRDGTITSEDVTAREEAKYMEEMRAKFAPPPKTPWTRFCDFFCALLCTIAYAGEWIWDRFYKLIMFAGLIFIGWLPIWLENDATVLVFLLLFIGPLLLPEKVQRWLISIQPEWARMDEDDEDLW